MPPGFVKFRTECVSNRTDRVRYATEFVDSALCLV
jgi:hypothetical protein